MSIALTLRAFMTRRAQFGKFLASKGPSLTMNRYFRLMALATVELMFTTPLSVYSIYSNLQSNPLQPWKGFADAHFHYSAVGQVPAIEWRSVEKDVFSLEMFRWGLPFCAIVFFGFFGFAEEARKHYRMVFMAIRKPFGGASSFSTSSSSSSIGFVLALYLLSDELLTF